uniref:GRP family sugar transporter n=1 Tax=Staphylococcus aureus TaxID=1280 RepID=UPI00210E3F98
MQFLGFFIGLFPAFFWGRCVSFYVVGGGGPFNPIRGTALGALLVWLGFLITGFAQIPKPHVNIFGLFSWGISGVWQANQINTFSFIGCTNNIAVYSG